MKLFITSPDTALFWFVVCCVGRVGAFSPRLALRGSGTLQRRNPLGAASVEESLPRAKIQTLDLSFVDHALLRQKRKRQTWRRMIPSRVLLPLLACQVFMTRVKSHAVMLQQDATWQCTQLRFALERYWQRMRQHQWQAVKVAMAVAYKFPLPTFLKSNTIGKTEPVGLAMIQLGVVGLLASLGFLFHFVSMWL